MSNNNESKIRNTYQSVTGELEAILDLAPQEIKKTWGDQVKKKMVEDDELTRIEQLVKDNLDSFSLYRRIKGMNLESEAGRRKEKEFENKAISEYFSLKSQTSDYPKKYKSWVISKIIAIAVTVLGLIIGFKTSFIGIVIAIIVALGFWLYVSIKKDDVNSLKKLQETVNDIEKEYIITKESVELKTS